MQTLTLAATKGGVSKTTLAAALAVHASLKGDRVAVVDCDPQRSLSHWHEARVRETGEAGKPALITPGKRRLEEIKAGAAALDWLILDLPPGASKITRQAIAAADLVLVPIRPSPIDVEAIRAMAVWCREEARDFMFVLTQTLPKDKGMTTGARNFLETMGAVAEAEISSRLSYGAAMLLGGVAPEQDPAAKAEIAALWGEVTKRLAAAKRAAKKGA